MKRHPITSSERRGLVALAIICMLVIGIGLGVSYCGRSSTPLEPPEVEVVYEPDSAEMARADSISKARRKARRDSLRRVRRDSLRKARGTRSRSSARTPKTYRQRSPIDEPVIVK